MVILYYVPWFARCLASQGQLSGVASCLAGLQLPDTSSHLGRYPADWETPESGPAATLATTLAATLAAQQPLWQTPESGPAANLAEIR